MAVVKDKINLKKFKRNLIQQKMYEFLAKKSGTESIKQLRERIESHLDITPRQLTAYMENVGQPDIKELPIIAQLLECSINELIDPII